MAVTLTQDMIAGAQATEKKYGIPASVTLAQIMLESGGSNKGGLSGLAANYNNLFGVTAGSSWKGQTVTMSNKAGTDTKTYRVYDSIQDSIEDHGKVLINERYTIYTSQAKDSYEYAAGIAKGGYAEDKYYSSKLQKIMRDNNLTQYDGAAPNSGSGHDSGGHRVDGDTITDSNGNVSQIPVDTEEGNLKWWGDLIVLVLSVLLIVLAVVFFTQAFGKSINPVKIANDKIKKGNKKGGFG